MIGGFKFHTLRDTLSDAPQLLNLDRNLFLDQDMPTFDPIARYLRNGAVELSLLSPITVLLAEKLEMQYLVAQIKSILYENIGQGPSPATAGLSSALLFDRVHGSLKASFAKGHAEFLHTTNPRADSDVAVATTRMFEDTEHEGQGLKPMHFVKLPGEIQASPCESFFALIISLGLLGFVPSSQDYGDGMKTVLFLRRRIPAGPISSNTVIVAGLPKSPAVHLQVKYALINDGRQFTINPVSKLLLLQGAVLAPPEYHQPRTANEEPLGKHQCSHLANPPVNWLTDNCFFKREPRLETLVHQAVASIPHQVGCDINFRVFSQSNPPALTEHNERLSEATLSFW